MEFNIEHKDNPNKKKYADKHVDIAYDFSKKVVKEFGSFVKSVVLFGSTARHEQHSNDIDILIIVDDVSINISDDLVDAYRVILEKLVIHTSKKLHVTTLKMTNFWDYIRKGDPLGLNILRDGVALYDLSLFEPLRILLAEGKVSPSRETMYVYLNKANGSLFNAKKHILHAVLDLYWAVIDISHAALMQERILPASPAQVADKLEETFVAKGKLSKKDTETMRFFYALSKKIIHNEISSITGKEYDEHRKRAEAYIEAVKKIIKKQ